MKARTTAREYNTAGTIRAGYCELQTLLRYRTPQYYTAGVYGWNCDIYHIYTREHGDMYISTGYNPTGKLNGGKLAREYEKRAEKIESAKHDRRITYERARELMDELIAEYIDAVIKSERGIAWQTEK